MDDSRVQELLATIKPDTREDDEAKELLAVKENLAYVWNSRDSNMLAILLGESKEPHRPFKFLSPTRTPLFDVDRIVPSPDGRWVCLQGRRGVSCVELPRKMNFSSASEKVDGKGPVPVRCVGVAERLFLAHPRLVAQKALWRPDCSNSLLAILTSDNYIRIFSLESSDAVEICSVPLGVDPVADANSSFFSASFSVKECLGETAVDFAVAPSTEDDVWPVFVLYGNGEVYLAMITAENKDANQVFGPLTMLPESPDNYGVDCCSLLCLPPVIKGSPPVLVLANSKGILYHCVLLSSSRDGTVTKWPLQGEGEEQQGVPISLYVYEAVELQLDLLTPKVKMFECPLMLTPDPSSPARYFCSHKVGVHSVGLPMVTQLAELALQDPENSSGSNLKSSSSFAVEQQSIVQHLVCTQPLLSSNSSPSAVLGLTIVARSSPPTLLCLLSDFEMLKLKLAAPGFIQPQPLSVASGESPQVSRSNGQESFEQKVKAMLRKETTLPLLKGSRQKSLSSQETLELLTKCTEILQEEYLDRLMAVRAELSRHVDVLAALRRSQASALTQVETQREGLRQRAAELSERYEDLHDSGARLQTRLDLVLRKITSGAPSASDAELEMLRTLKELGRRRRDLSNSLDQVKAKEAYQLRQQEAEARLQGRSKKSLSDERLGGQQVLKVKEVLEEDSREVTEMVRRLNELKKDLVL